MTKKHWDPCVSHRDDDVAQFIGTFFGQANRFPLLICGAGFDPRATENAKLLSAAAKDRLSGIFIREDRPRPDQALVTAADQNEATLLNLVPSGVVEHISIFSDDEKTVIGGRRAVALLHAYDLSKITDVVVDLSALSTGISFPLVRYLLDRSQREKGFPNVHIFVCTDTEMDDAVQTQLMDKPQSVPGFGEELALAEGLRKPKLWLPQLAKQANTALDLIYRNIEFEETCPILPFPAHDCRAVEQLIEIYQLQITESWTVDDRDFLFAAEDDPLDLYRTILRIDTQRRATYAIEGGALTILSPLGTKAMALGALLAALDRDLPIVYVETQRYMLRSELPKHTFGLIHLWLTGEAYVQASVAEISGDSPCPTSSEPVSSLSI